MKLSVVIPCYPPHQVYIPKLIVNLEEQIVRPNEIIISLSETTAEQGDALQQEWSLLSPHIPIKVTTWPEKANAAVNRNNGALEASGDYIIFLDGDDIYSPSLLSCLNTYISKFNPMALLFQYTTKKTPFHKLTEESYNTNRIYFSKELYEHLYPANQVSSQATDYYNLSPQIELGANIAHGCITVKKEVWEQHPQQDIGGREDSFYIRELLQSWHQTGREGEGVIVIPDILMWYAPYRHLE